MSWNSFLIKVLMEKEVCGSHEQCMRHTGKAKMRFSKKKKEKKKKEKEKENADADKLYPKR